MCGQLGSSVGARPRGGVGMSLDLASSREVSVPARLRLRVKDAPSPSAKVPPRTATGAFDAAMAVPSRRLATWENSYLRLVVGLDISMAVVAGLFGILIRSDESMSSSFKYVQFAAVLPLLWLALLKFNGAYERRFLYIGSEESRRVAISGMTLVAVVSFTVFALQEAFSRGYMLGSFPVLILGTIVARYALRKLLHRRRAAGACMERTIVVGHPRPVTEMTKRLRREQFHGLDVIASCLPPGVDAGTRALDGDLPLADAQDIVGAVEVFRATVVVVLACPEMDGQELRRLSWRLESTGAQLLVAPALVDVTGPRTSVRLASGLPLLHVEPPEVGGFRWILKAAFDRFSAACGLLLLTPLLAFITLLIRSEDGQSAIFTQRRVGRHGKEFTLLKFRTMHVDAEKHLGTLLDQNEHDGVLFKMQSDPRVTRIGKVLRRYSLDELPQLVNVLRGEMSLVGPRPPLASEVSKYDLDLRRRLVVSPGLTGLWQVSGRSDLSWEESRYLDLHYVENWTPALDVMILFKTARAVVQARGAY